MSPGMRLFPFSLLVFSAQSLAPHHRYASRRKWMGEAAGVAGGIAAGGAAPAFAVDVSTLKREGETDDAARLRAIKNAGKVDAESVEFTVLDSGVQFAEYKEGKGDTVEMGKRVAVKCTGRLPALATKEAPGGLQFFNSKYSDIDELNWRLGDGTTVAGLEEGMVGMKKGGLRRIIVPNAYFTNKSGEKLRKGLQPQPNGERGQRWFDSVVNNPRRDQTVVYEVQVERIEKSKARPTASDAPPSSPLAGAEAPAPASVESPPAAVVGLDQ